MEGLSRTWAGPGAPFAHGGGESTAERQHADSGRVDAHEMQAKEDGLPPVLAQQGAQTAQRMHRKTRSGPSHLSVVSGTAPAAYAAGSGQGKGEETGEPRSLSGQQSITNVAEDTAYGLRNASIKAVTTTFSSGNRVEADVTSENEPQNRLSSSVDASSPPGLQQGGQKNTSAGGHRADASFGRPLVPSSPRAAYRMSLQGVRARAGPSTILGSIVSLLLFPAWVLQAGFTVCKGTLCGAMAAPSWTWARSASLSACHFLWVWLTVPCGLYTQVGIVRGRGIGMGWTRAGGAWGGTRTLEENWSAEAEAETQREWLLLYGPSARMDLIGHIGGHLHGAIVYALLSFREGQGCRCAVHAAIQLLFAGLNGYVYKLERTAYDSTMAAQADYENRESSVPVGMSARVSTDGQARAMSGVGGQRASRAARAEAVALSMRKYCRLGLAMSPVREYVQRGHRSLALVCMAVSLSWMACAISLECTLNPRAWGHGYGMCVSAADPVIPWYLSLLSFYAQYCIASDYASKQSYVVGGVLAAALPAQATLAYLFLRGPYRGHTSVENSCQLLFLSFICMMHNLHKGSARNVQMRMLVKRLEYIEGSTALRAMQHRAEIDRVMMQGQKHATKALPAVLDRYTAPIRDKLHVLVGAADAVLSRLEARKGRVRRDESSAAGSAPASATRRSPLTPPSIVTSRDALAASASLARPVPGPMTGAAFDPIPTPALSSVDDELDAAEADLRSVLQDGASILDTLSHEQVRAQAGAYLVRQMSSERSLQTQAGSATGRSASSFVHEMPAGPFTFPGGPSSGSQHQLSVDSAGRPTHGWFTPPGSDTVGTALHEDVAAFDAAYRGSGMTSGHAAMSPSHGLVVSASDAIDDGGGLYATMSGPGPGSLVQGGPQASEAVDGVDRQDQAVSGVVSPRDGRAVPVAEGDLHEHHEHSEGEERPPSFQAHLRKSGRSRARGAQALVVDPVAASRAAASTLLQALVPDGQGMTLGVPQGKAVEAVAGLPSTVPLRALSTRSAPDLVQAAGALGGKLSRGGPSTGSVTALMDPRLPRLLNIRTPQRRNESQQALKDAHDHRTVFPVATAADRPAPPLPPLHPSSPPIASTVPLPVSVLPLREPMLAGGKQSPVGHVSAEEALEDSGVKAVLQKVAAESTDIAVQSTGLGDTQAACLLQPPPLACPSKPAKADRHRRQGSAGTFGGEGSVAGTPVFPAPVIQPSPMPAAGAALTSRYPPSSLATAVQHRAGRVQEHQTPRPAIQKSSSPEDSHGGTAGFGSSGSGRDTSPEADTSGGASGKSELAREEGADRHTLPVSAPFDNTDRLPDSLFAETERHRDSSAEVTGAETGHYSQHVWGEDRTMTTATRASSDRPRSTASGRAPAMMPVLPAGLLPPGVAASLAQHRAVSPAMVSHHLSPVQASRQPLPQDEEPLSSRTAVANTDSAPSDDASPAGRPVSTSPDEASSGPVHSRSMHSGSSGHVARGDFAGLHQHAASRQGMAATGTLSATSEGSGGRPTPSGVVVGTESGEGTASAAAADATASEPSDMLQPLLGFELAHGILPHVHVCDGRLMTQLGVDHPWQVGASTEMLEGVEAAYQQAMEEHARAVASNDTSVLVRLGRGVEEVFGPDALVYAGHGRGAGGGQNRAAVSQRGSQALRLAEPWEDTPQCNGHSNCTSVTASGTGSVLADAPGAGPNTVAGAANIPVAGASRTQRLTALIQPAAPLADLHAAAVPPVAAALSSGSSSSSTRPFANAVALHRLQRGEGASGVQAPHISTPSGAHSGNTSQGVGQATAEAGVADVSANRSRAAPPGGSPASVLQALAGGSQDSARVTGASRRPAAQPSPGATSAIAVARPSPARSEAASTFVFGGSTGFQAAAGGDAGGQAASFGLHVLVVDDEKVNRTIAGRYLQRLGCTWDLADDGRDVPDALLLSEKPYDVILLDILMKHSNGLEVCRALRTELNVDIPVIAATANYSATEAGLYRAAGFTRVLQKPYNQRDLAAALTQALGIQLGRQAARLHVAGSQGARVGGTRH